MRCFFMLVSVHLECPVCEHVVPVLAVAYTDVKITVTTRATR